MRLWDQITGEQLKIFTYTSEQQWDTTRAEIVTLLKNAITGEVVHPSGKLLGAEKERVVECLLAKTPEQRAFAEPSAPIKQHNQTPS